MVNFNIQIATKITIANICQRTATITFFHSNSM